MIQVLSQGMSGPHVKALQDVLNFHIRRLEPLKVDGIFGPKTRARVVEFQKVNGLKPDGLVGPKTNALLYEVTELPVPILLMPKLTNPESQFQTKGINLSQSQFGSGIGLQPPQLIPPLQWPGPPFPVPLPFINLQSFSLLSNSSTILPGLTTQPNALGLRVTVPTRKDPADPFVQSRQAIIELIDDLPVDSKFKVFLISKIPNPVTTISPPPAGFRWGASPLFNPFDPTGFGVKGNAQFMLRVTDGGNGLPNMVFGAWGDGKFFLNFDTKQGESKPAVKAEGQVFLGVQGIF